MILGIDVGSFATKRSDGFIFDSKVSTIEDILKNNPTLKTDDGMFYIGEGSYNTNYRKIEREYYRELFIYSIAYGSPKTTFIKAVVGLPISQYKQDKEILKQILLENKVNKIEVNGESKTIIIDDVEVYPEGIAAVEDDFEGVIIDIGGRTTDICLVLDGVKRKKIENPFSIPIGTLNLYNDFINSINSKLCLDLKIEDTERILRKGLTVDGENVDCRFAIECFKRYVDDLVNKIQVEYSIRTLDLRLVGGGALLLSNAIKKRIPRAIIAANSVFANAIGFKRIGEQIWQ